MFTGLIETIGHIRTLRPEGPAARIDIEAPEIAASLTEGESVAVDGACLTVESASDSAFTAFASAETLRRTTLGEAGSGRAVNLERALELGDRLGGHLVMGHVDGQGRIASVEAEGEGVLLRAAAPSALLEASVEKGSIAVDGISLTLYDIDAESFCVAVIPETWQRTTLSGKQPGEAVNIETDLIGKYVLRALGPWRNDAAAPSPRSPGSVLDLLR